MARKHGLAATKGLVKSRFKLYINSYGRNKRLNLQSNKWLSGSELSTKEPLIFTGSIKRSLKLQEVPELCKSTQQALGSIEVAMKVVMPCPIVMSARSSQRSTRIKRPICLDVNICKKLLLP